MATLTNQNSTPSAMHAPSALGAQLQNQRQTVAPDRRSVPSSNRPVAHEAAPKARPAQSGREGWRQALIAKHYGMVQAIARRLVTRLPSSVEVDDLISAGTLGLVESADRFELGRGVPFEAFARSRIRGAMVDSLRSDDWVPHGVRVRADVLRQGRESLAMDLGHAPTVSDMASVLAVSVDTMHRMQANAHAVPVVSMETPLGADGNATIESTLANDEDILERIANRELSADVESALRCLPEREALAVRMYYFENASLERIGEVLGVALSRAYQLRCRGVERLAFRLQRYASV